MPLAHVFFENGLSIETQINGSPESIRKYYKIGRLLNLGCTGDNMQKITKLNLYEDGELIPETLVHRSASRLAA